MLAITLPETQQPRWQPSHMPRLSFRNNAPEQPDQRPELTTTPSTGSQGSEEIIVSQSTDVGSPPMRARSRSPGTTARNRSSVANTMRSTTRWPATVSNANTNGKKRGSIFNSLFVKEPSSVALEQMAQKLIADHGELSARAVPGVSCCKMPENVPKVNAKWDGVPGAVKAKDAVEKRRREETARAPGSPGRSRSTGPSSNERLTPNTESTRRRMSNSTMSSFDSRAGTRDLSPANPSHDWVSSTKGSDKASSSNASSSGQRRPPSLYSQKLRSPSGSSLPEITAFFPNDIPAPPPLPAKFRQEVGARTLLPKASVESIKRAKSPLSLASTPEPLSDALPDHYLSPATTPSEQAPSTPPSACTPGQETDSNLSTRQATLRTSVLRSKPEEVLLTSSGLDVLSPPVRPKRKVMEAKQAFLAGEARPVRVPKDGTEMSPGAFSQARGGSYQNTLTPSNIARVQHDLEKRPDSSRARLGLRASMVVDKSALPWESQLDLDQANSSSRLSENNSKDSALPISPKFRPKSFGLFNRDRAEK